MDGESANDKLDFLAEAPRLSLQYRHHDLILFEERSLWQWKIRTKWKEGLPGMLGRSVDDRSDGIETRTDVAEHPWLRMVAWKNVGNSGEMNESRDGRENKLIGGEWGLHLPFSRWWLFSEAPSRPWLAEDIISDSAYFPMSRIKLNILIQVGI